MTTKSKIDVSLLLQEIEKIQQITPDNTTTSKGHVDRFEQMLRALVVLEGSILLANPSITSQEMYQQIFCNNNKENNHRVNVNIISPILTIESFNISYEFTKKNYMNYLEGVYIRLFTNKGKLK